MKIILKLKQSAFDALAKELRRASWGAAVIIATAIFKENFPLSIGVSVLVWGLLQFCAFILECIKIADKGDFNHEYN